MAEYEQNVSKVEEVEATGRGLFDLGRKKGEGEKPHRQEEAISTEFDEKVKVSEPEHKHGGLLEKLHRSDSSSSSSSDEEEVGERGEKKKKKKKGLKEKLSGDDKKEEHKAEGHHHEHEEDTSIPVERYDEPVAHAEPEEKKGTLLDKNHKIKEKLPGGHKKADQEVAPPPPPPSSTVEYSAAAAEGCEAKEKKGFLDKIKEKLPGFHPKPEEEKEKEKEKEKEAASHY